MEPRPRLPVSPDLGVCRGTGHGEWRVERRSEERRGSTLTPAVTVGGSCRGTGFGCQGLCSPLEKRRESAQRLIQSARSPTTPRPRSVSGSGRPDLRSSRGYPCVRRGQDVDLVGSRGRCSADPLESVPRPFLSTRVDRGVFLTRIDFRPVQLDLVDKGVHPDLPGLGKCILPAPGPKDGAADRVPSTFTLTLFSLPTRPLPVVDRNDRRTFRWAL